MLYCWWQAVAQLDRAAMFWPSRLITYVEGPSTLPIYYVHDRSTSTSPFILYTPPPYFLYMFVWSQLSEAEEKWLFTVTRTIKFSCICIYIPSSLMFCGAFTVYFSTLPQMSTVYCSTTPLGRPGAWMPTCKLVGLRTVTTGAGISSGTPCAVATVTCNTERVSSSLLELESPQAHLVLWPPSPETQKGLVHHY